MASAATTGTLGKNSTNLDLAHLLGQTLDSRPTSNGTPIVFLVGEDPSERHSLESLIRREVWQLETFQSAQELLARPRPFVPTCLILALSVPDLNDLEAQRQIARERAETRVIFAANYADTPTIVQAMKAGAVDFFVKPFIDDVLVSAIREGLQRSLAALRREVEIRDIRKSYALLTPRERQVMALVVSGLLNKQVGGELGISELTVKAHRGQVMQKMKANSLADLVRMAVKLRPAPQTILVA
jgi:FixJ family two-component response regulator